MTHRQTRSFLIGCGLWILTGVLQMAAHFRGWPDPVTDEEVTLFTLLQGYELGFGGVSRTVAELHEGLGLSVAVLLFLAGFAGLIWLRAPGVPSGILKRVAGMNAVAALALLLLGIPRAPLVPLLCYAAACVAFLLAAGGPAGALGLRPDRGGA